MKRITIFLVFMNVVQGWAQSGFRVTNIFPVDASHSYVGFSVRYMGYATVRGRFTEFRGAIHYDEQDLSKTSVTLVIDVSSIDTGDKWRDNDLLSDNWFNQPEFPRIYFVSTKAEAAPNGLLIHGEIIMRGIKKMISIPLNRPIGVVSDVRGDSQIIFTGSLILNRVEFGIEGKRWAGVVEGITAVSDEVSIELTILGKRINAGNFKNWVQNPATPHGKIYSMLASANIETVLLEFDVMSKDPNIGITSETLNTVGLMLMKENRLQEAMAILKRNLQAFPAETVVYETYAEALAMSGQSNEALSFYLKAIEKDAWNVVAREAVRWMQR